MVNMTLPRTPRMGLLALVLSSSLALPAEAVGWGEQASCDHCSTKTYSSQECKGAPASTFSLGSHPTEQCNSKPGGDWSFKIAPGCLDFFAFASPDCKGSPLSLHEGTCQSNAGGSMEYTCGWLGNGLVVLGAVVVGVGMIVATALFFRRRRAGPPGSPLSPQSPRSPQYEELKDEAANAQQ